MGAVRCLSCGHLNDRNTFCGRCGKRLPVKKNLAFAQQGAPAASKQADLISIPEKIELVRSLLSRDPDNVEARCELGEFYYRLGKMSLAEKEFKIVKAVDPSNITAREHLAGIHREAGENEGAIRELEAVESLSGCPVSSLVILAELRLLAGRTEEAKRTFRRAIEKEPGNIKLRLRYEKLLIEEE